MMLGVAILTGGASSRMGADKAALDWAGVRAVDRLAALAERLGAHALLTVGGADYGLQRATEEPPGGGPAAGVLAGARNLAQAGCRRALVLAADAPTLQPADLLPLLRASAPGAVYAGLPLPLVLDLAALPGESAWGWPLRRLVDALGLRPLPAPAGAKARLRGANTPAERDALLAVLGERGAAPGLRFTREMAGP
jgi:molybdopterin-guanine dinucleotide biosynthesis protein A